jgi:inorganic pyrophosphatase
MLSTFRQNGSINVVVETPRGSGVKFKHDPETGMMMLSRPLPVGITYPYDWGYIPATRAADGDPLDAMIVWDGTSYPGTIVPSRLIGVLKVEQTNVKTGLRERNDRLFALPTKAPRFEQVRTVFDLPGRVRDELELFFVTVVAFERKEVTLLGFEGPTDAELTLRQALTPELKGHPTCP